ncbi:dihydropteroate synthase [Salinisphaera sp. SPP-AMP-43]|uniref:dihydropteroate synthase n=1 Tax=Salinisphaera sp. SPP-AMP-43 TaxID=3121288 RepID=UPI003C6E87CF
MGVLNVTPDSFSDGGRYTTRDTAVARALEMIDNGARIIDIGGESTRPGATPVPVEEELARVVPVVEALRETSDVFISVDTSQAEVIRASCAAGADMINDVRGLAEDGALAAVIEADAAACVMHMQGRPATMQAEPRYADVIGEVSAYLHERVAACRAAGMTLERLVVDPGFGFGKSLAHNLDLLRAIGELDIEGRPVLMGVSRKSMFAKLFESDDMGSRINGSLGAAFWAAQRGVSIIRCHDVRETAQMVRLARAIVADDPVG